MKKILIIIPLVLLVAGGVVLMKKRKKEIAQAPLPAPITYAVRTVRATDAQVKESASFLARVAAKKQAGISSKIAGRIEEVLVSESDSVRKGDPLVRIDDAELLASRRSLDSQRVALAKQLEYAKNVLQRNKALFRAGGLAREKLQASEVEVARARAALSDLQAKREAIDNQLSYLKIQAPFDGVIGTVFQHQGDMATAGKPILTLNSRDKKLTFGFVPANHAISPGQEVLWQAKHLGRITALYDEADNGLTVAEIKPEIELNMPVASFLPVTVILGQQTGCAVPVQALLHQKDSVQVMAYHEGRFQGRKIRVVVQGQDQAVIEPCPADPVAVAPEAKLRLLPGHGQIQILDRQDT